ncbi:MAG: 2-oxo-4-hydroxy-4-carboxy-5-ureidoimidazoline decarboxylase [Proteobacteria bacterium]|nr:2-oxo-4-hydroxy-4-carboxy-5-ureidoimidazoline decarboxylase [Pseudomonadota bacterium]
MSKNLPSAMTPAQFVAVFGGIFEESPWVAETLWHEGISTEHDTPTALAAAMVQVVQHAGSERQQALIMAHPVLGTQQKMGAYSMQEQQQANLTAMSASEAQQLQQLNHAYMEKFNMPFIMAVKGKTTPTIIATLQQRLQTNAPAEEQENALQEIYKIATLRLQALWQK